VKKARVTVGETLAGAIETGLVAFLGVEAGDEASDAIYIADKIAGLRVFEDADGKMNRSALDTGGAVLAVSQFTLLGDVRKGKRPNFTRAARPEHAEPLCRKKSVMRRVVIRKVPFIGISDPCRADSEGEAGM
jgi:D-tyrosyl-tRNA(Tyr) deacylase